MRIRLIVVAMLVAAAASGSVVFVTPQPGSQMIGQQIVEITTDSVNVDRAELYIDGALAGVARTAPYRFLYDFGTNVNARTITAKVLSNGYRKTETAEITTIALTAGETMNVDVVEVPLRVRSRDRTIKADDLRVRENSVDQKIRDVVTTRGNAHFAFVVDRSLSMTNGKLEAALRAVDHARTALRAGDTASLTLFNHRVSPPEPLNRRLTASRAIDTTAPSGGTSLRDAVASTIAPAERTYVFVITDGGDRNSVLSEEAALRRISGTKTVVSAVTLGKATSFLSRATDNTGGTLLRATPQTIGQQLSRIIEDINGRYLLVYQSTGNAVGWRSITVSARRSGVEVIAARKGYFAQ